MRPLTNSTNAKKINILFVIETLANSGAERVIVNTLPELQKLGFKCTVAILFQRDELAKELEIHDIQVHRLNLSYKWNILEGVYKLIKLLKKNHFDIIHAHLFFAYFYTGLITIFYPSKKTVTTFHNLGYESYPANTIRKKLRKSLDSFVVNNLINNKVAVSNAVLNHYKHHLNIDTVDLIFNSFPLEIIKTGDISRLDVLKYYVNINLYDCFSITPGRFVKEKGHQYLFQALKAARKKTKGLCHFIVGAGPLEKEIRKCILENKLSNVIVIPSLVQQDLFDLINACDFVVVPSISEGFGMVIGESMALHKPVIATEIHGVSELVKHNKEGLLVPPKDYKYLAQAIERIYIDKTLRKSLVVNASRKIQQFDTQIIAKQWKKFYEEILN